ncbi:MAG: hypothetical protein ACOYVK_11410 [Bacillota bacterium]
MEPEDMDVRELNAEAGCNHDIQKKKQKKNDNLYSNLAKGFFGIFKMCSEMEANQESCRIYEGEILRKNDMGEQIKGKYKFGIQIGNLPSKSDLEKARDCKSGCNDDESEVENHE